MIHVFSDLSFLDHVHDHALKRNEIEKLFKLNSENFYKEGYANSLNWPIYQNFRTSSSSLEDQFQFRWSTSKDFITPSLPP